METDETTKSGRVRCHDSEDPTVVIITDFGVWPLAVRHKSSVPVSCISHVNLKVASLHLHSLHVQVDNAIVLN